MGGLTLLDKWMGVEVGEGEEGRERDLGLVCEIIIIIKCFKRRRNEPKS